jgi:hypothetical protein
MRSFVMALVLATAVSALGAAPASAQAAATPPATPPAAAPAAPAQRQFNQDGGIVLHYILADKAADFESAMLKVKEALQKSAKPERKQQAATWKVFKAGPGPTGTVLYAFVIDPSLKNADYSIGALLVEGLGEEGRAIYQKYADCYPKTGPSQVVINLEMFSDFGK